MGQFTAYSLCTALVLLAGYLVYKWLMAREKQIVLNRITLLGIYAVAFLAMPATALVHRLFQPAPAGDISVLVPEGATIHIATANEALPAWPALVVGIYFAGMAVVLIHTIFVFSKILRIIRTGKHMPARQGHSHIIVTDAHIAPFSWAEYIVMSRDDYDKAGEIITTHECAHIAHRHWIDLLIAQAVCVVQWFNPASWLLLEELKSVHEYQADESVLAGGTDARSYQMLLIKKAVGTRFHSIANSLNHSNLKKRITMMYNPSSPVHRRLRGFALVPALALALAATDIPAVAGVLRSTRAVVFDDKDTKKYADCQELPDPEIAPVYPGGEAAMWKFLAENIVYPAEMRDHYLYGVVVMRFRIEPDGSLSTFVPLESPCPEADAEVKRVLSAMPRWTPGFSDGHPTACDTRLTVSFRLEDYSPVVLADIVVVAHTGAKPAKSAIDVTARVKNKPVVVNGKTYTDHMPADFDPGKIRSITIERSSEAYPGGRIIMDMKN